MSMQLFMLDAHPVVLDGLRRVLENQPDIQLAGAAATLGDALEQWKLRKPDVLLVDPTQEKTDFAEVLRRLQMEYPSVPVLVFSVVDENLLARRCMEAGAMGYLMKTEPVDRLLMAIRLVASGGVAFGTDLIRRMFSNPGMRELSNGRSGPGMLLSRRQLEVFEMLGNGLDSATIAEKLDLSPRTVDVHKSHIRHVLGLASAGEVLRAAIQWVKSGRVTTESIQQEPSLLP